MAIRPGSFCPISRPVLPVLRIRSRRTDWGQIRVQATSSPNILRRLIVVSGYIEHSAIGGPNSSSCRRAGLNSHLWIFGAISTCPLVFPFWSFNLGYGFANFRQQSDLHGLMPKFIRVQSTLCLALISPLYRGRVLCIAHPSYPSLDHRRNIPIY